MHCSVFGLHSQMPVASPPKGFNNPKCPQTLPTIPWGKNHPWLRTTALDHPNPCYLYDLISCTLSSLIPPSYMSLFAIPQSCQVSSHCRAFAQAGCKLGCPFPRLSSPDSPQSHMTNSVTSFKSLLKHHCLSVVP